MLPMIYSNPSVALGFEFQLLATTQGFWIYSAIEYINEFYGASKQTEL
jgi:hypothetical protein